MRASTFVFVDTSAWGAWINRDDLNYSRARQFMATRPRLLTSNFVIDETITLILKRMGYAAAARLGDTLWDGSRARIIYVSKADQRAAWQLFKKYDDKIFSFTDCTSFVIMQRLGLTQAFTFDSDFEQTGHFIRVPR